MVIIAGDNKVIIDLFFAFYYHLFLRSIIINLLIIRY